MFIINTHPELRVNTMKWNYDLRKATILGSSKTISLHKQPFKT